MASWAAAPMEGKPTSPWPQLHGHGFEIGAYKSLRQASPPHVQKGQARTPAPPWGCGERRLSLYGAWLSQSFPFCGILWPLPTHTPTPTAACVALCPCQLTPPRACALWSELAIR